MDMHSRNEYLKELQERCAPLLKTEVNRLSQG